MKTTIIAAAVLLILATPAVAPVGAGILSNGTLPPVPVPPDNPQTEAKVRLGKQLYFDPRLSADNTVSCASCHDPNAGWADPRQFSEGVGGAKGGRNAPTVLNSGYNHFQFWDGRAASLEEQALGPIQNPVEMKMTLDEVVARLKGIPGYVQEFQQVFGTEPNADGVAKAIAAFERSVLSTDSPYDRYIQGDQTAMTKAQIRGMDVFMGKGKCITCHSGPNFSDSQFHNIGVGCTKTTISDPGRGKITGDPKDMGCFKTPTLRSVALTAPYLHDGSEKTLEGVVEFYDRGGNPNPNLDRKIVRLNLTRQEKEDLVQFMHALTGKDVKITPPELPK